MLEHIKTILAAINGQGSWLAAMKALIALVALGLDQVPAPTGPMTMDLLDEEACVQTLRDYVDASSDPTRQAAFAIPWAVLIPYFMKLFGDFWTKQKSLPS